jgi:hypothetical protein
MLAGESYEELLRMRIRAETLLKDERLIPTSIANIRAYFRRLALGVEFMRKQVGAANIPRNFVVWGVTPGLSSPVNPEIPQFLPSSTYDTLGISPAVLVKCNVDFYAHGNHPRRMRAQSMTIPDRLCLAYEYRSYLPVQQVMDECHRLALHRGATLPSPESLKASLVQEWGLHGYVFRGKIGESGGLEKVELNPDEFAAHYLRDEIN